MGQMASLLICSHGSEFVWLFQNVLSSFYCSSCDKNKYMEHYTFVVYDQINIPFTGGNGSKLAFAPIIRAKVPLSPLAKSSFRAWTT